MSRRIWESTSVFHHAFCYLCIFRYLYWFNERPGGDTSEMIVTDKPFALNIFPLGASILILL